MLFVLIKQIVEDLLVQKSDAFKVVSGAWLKRHDLVDEPVGLVAQVGNVLLSVDFLLYVG